MACNINVTGRLGRDPELKYLESGQQVVKFTICARQAKVRGEDPPALWFTVEVWGNAAEWIANNLVKGEMVYVSGELSLQKWTHRETGELKESLTIKRGQVEKQLAQRQEGEGQAPAPAAAAPPAAEAVAPAAAAPAQLTPSGPAEYQLANPGPAPARPSAPAPAQPAYAPFV
jgi:single-strand DNA-binding protein